MTTERKEVQELLILPNLVSLRYRFDTGPYMGRFFVELRDHKRIWANKCPKCGRLNCPPKPFCGRCHGVENTEWVEQGDEGVLLSFDIHYYEFFHPRTGKIQPVPWVEGVVLLDGGANIQHYLMPPDPEKLKAGDRYKAVWKEVGRKGDAHDILYFTKKDTAEPPKQKEPTMNEPPKLKEPHLVPGLLEASYKHSAGVMASKFYVELRDNKKIMGARCPKCKKIYMPPTSVCGKCFSKVDELVELSGKGTVISYTVVNYSEQAHPVEAPFAYGIIQLDGADTGLLHFLNEVDFDKITIGIRVEPVFKEKREGNLLDIKYFKPL